MHGREVRHAKTLHQGQVNPINVEVDDVEVLGARCDRLKQIRQGGKRVWTWPD